MVHAEEDWEHGADDDETAALKAANRAGAMAHEVHDDVARALVIEWKRQFDAIPKGWKHQVQYSRRPPGYRESDWIKLRNTANEAASKHGAVLREQD